MVGGDEPSPLRPFRLHELALRDQDGTAFSFGAWQQTEYVCRRFAAHERNGQSRVHGIKLGGEGDVTATHRLWKREDLGVFVSSPAVYKGRIYLLRHRGGVVCLDPATGKTVWSDALPEDKSPYYASPTVASGIFYAAREDGVVFAVRVGERFELLGANPMSERIVASPVPVANRLLLSGDSHLFCVAGTDL